MADSRPPDAWIVDASVALKWFLPVEHDPDEVLLARSLIGTAAMRTTSLAVYELGSIMTRHSGWQDSEIAAALALLRRMCPPIELTPDDERRTAGLAREHDLSFRAASYVAVAQRARRRLLSADEDLLRSGLAVGLADAAT